MKTIYLRDFERIGKVEGYSIEQIAEYGQYIQMLKTAQEQYDSTKITETV